MKAQKTNLTELMGLFNGVGFVGIREYESSTTGKIANYVVNVGISNESVNKKDLKTLKSISKEELIMLSEATEIELDVFEIAHSELIVSLEKNMGGYENRTNQSRGQIDAYINLTKNGIVKYNKNTNNISILAMKVSEVELKPGEYKPVKSHKKTIAKNAIKKAFDLRSNNYRRFTISNFDTLRAMGGEYCLETNIFTPNGI